MIAMPAEDTWTVLVSGEQTGGRFAIIEARERQGAEPPRHVHSREDEFIYVLEGRLSIEQDGERFDRPSGTWLFLPRGSEHSFSVESQQARILVMLTPAGLESCQSDLRRAEQPVAEHQRVEQLVAVAARYGVAITGPAQPP